MTTTELIIRTSEIHFYPPTSKPHCSVQYLFTMLFDCGDNYISADYPNQIRNSRTDSNDFCQEEAKHLFNKREMHYYPRPKSQDINKEIVSVAQKNLENARKSLDTAYNIAVDVFKKSTRDVKDRAQHIFILKSELERTRNSSIEKTQLLEQKYNQLRFALSTLQVCKSIAQECYDLRLTKYEANLFDETQELLSFEKTLCRSIEQLVQDLMEKAKRQIAACDAIRRLIEYDWSDKTTAYEAEVKNIELSTKSFNVKKYDGLGGLNDGQTDLETWEQLSLENIRNCDAETRAAISCCDEIDASLLNASRDLRSHNYNVNKALQKDVAWAERMRIDLEQQLKKVLVKIVKTESLMITLSDEIKNTEHRIAVVQTRLHNKHRGRPNDENCREDSLYSLINEQENLNQIIGELEIKLQQSEELKCELEIERGKLEKEITIRRKSIYVDRDRCQHIRNHFPGANELSGLGN